MKDKKLDDAIDRTVRDMTHVAADDDAVARVMARLRESDARDAHGARGAHDASASEGTGWILTPRVAWGGLVAVLLMVLLGRYAWHPLNRQAETPHVVATAQPQSSQPSQSPQPSQSSPPVAAREFPTPVVTAPSTVQATTARNIRGRVVTPSSVVNGATDASEEGRGQLEMPPLESDMVIASITPAPLADAAAIQVEPLITSSLQVDEIPVPSIDMPPVSPERRE
jgi:hypothetical protein